MTYPESDQEPFRVVALRGDVDMHCSPEARKQILAALHGPEGVLVDLSEVDYIDSSGIASLVEALQLARERGVEFALTGVSEATMRVLELARLDEIFPIHGSPGRRPRLPGE